MFDLDFAKPSPALASHVADYYLVRIDAPMIEDVERADVGYLRFMFSGSGWYKYQSGPRDAGHRIMLLGPSTEIAHYTVTGPMYIFGAVLLPEFWGGIADCDATDFANRALDATGVLGTEVHTLCDQLEACGSVEEMARLANAWLLRRIRPVPADHLEVINKIGEWLCCSPIPAPDRLYAETGKSDRQVMRLANRHFGAPPRMLARKYRALRTASRIIGTRGSIPDELADEYSDRAHMNREIKYFTGMTPKQLQVNANPILLATLHPSNFRAEAPWT
jgi:AraC-like DNA-binding protein